MQTVVVSPVAPLQLIETAIDRIPENFGAAHTKRGFYRLVSKSEGAFLHLSEAVFDVYLPGYGARKGKDQFKLIKKRSVRDEKGTHGIDLGLKPHSLFEYDIVSDFKHSKLLSKRALKKYDFEWKGIREIAGKQAHEIYFDQREGLRQSYYRGTIYLEKESLAIMHIDLSLSPQGIEYAQFGDPALRALLGLSGLKIGIISEGFQVVYQEYAGKWYLSHCSNDVQLSFRNRNENYDFVADIRTDYLVSALDTAAVQPFAQSERLHPGTFIEKKASSGEASFWKDYTIILADYKFEEIEAMIMMKNKEE